MSSDTKILSSESLTKLPMGWNNVPRSRRSTVTSSYSKGQSLAHQNRVRLPILPPVSTHWHPPSSRALNIGVHNIPCTRDVADEHQVKVTESVNSKPYPPMLSTCHPSVCHRDNASAVFGDFKEHWHGQVEVRTRRVAPTAIVVWKSIIWWTEVSGGYEYWRTSRVTPFSVVCAFYLKASTAT